MKPKSNQKGSITEPKQYDLCQSPPYAVAPLLPYLKPFLTVWEPASGGGYLADALEMHSHRYVDVVKSDILRGQNFFTYNPSDPPYERGWDAIVTNPPYSIKYEWIARCYELGKPFALLVPLETLGAAAAQKLLQKHGFEVMLLDQRVDFKMPNKGWSGGAQFPVIWLCHRILPVPIVFGSIRAEKRKFVQGLKGAAQMELGV